MSSPLVIAVPAKGGKVKSLADLAKPGITIAAGSASVPVGGYTRQVLSRLPKPEAKKILGNIRSNEPDVAGVVGKVSQRAVDAGFVYATDVKAAGSALRPVDVPARLRPTVTYAAAVVKSSKHQAQAERFIAGLVRGGGQAALRRAGFLPLTR